MNSILIRPIITEKTTAQAGNGWFTFAVDKDSNKNQIVRVINEQFKVHVIKIVTVTVHGKTKKVGRRGIIIRSSNWKKAMVKLKPNEKIDLFTVPEKPVVKTK